MAANGAFGVFWDKPAVHFGDSERLTTPKPAARRAAKASSPTSKPADDSDYRDSGSGAEEADIKLDDGE